MLLSTFYLCESLMSALVAVKPENRECLLVENYIRVSLSDIMPRTDKLLLNLIVITATYRLSAYHLMVISVALYDTLSLAYPSSKRHSCTGWRNGRRISQSFYFSVFNTYSLCHFGKKGSVWKFEWYYSSSVSALKSLCKKVQTVGKHESVKVWFAVNAVTMKASAVPSCPRLAVLLTRQSGHQLRCFFLRALEMLVPSIETE